MCVFHCTPLARAHAYAALHNASASDLLYLPVSFQFTSFSCACSLHLHAWKRLNGLTNSSESHTNLSLFPTGLPERDTYPSLHNLTTASCLRPSSFNKSLTPAYDHNTLFTGHSKLNVSAFLRYDGNLYLEGVQVQRTEYPQTLHPGASIVLEIQTHMDSSHENVRADAFQEPTR